MSPKPMPRDSRSQEIGRNAATALSVQKPSNWIPDETDGDLDYGIDYSVNLKNDNDEIIGNFPLQLKGTTDPKYSIDRTQISFSFNISTLNLYENLLGFIVVAVVDLSQHESQPWKCPIYYRILDEEFFDELGDLPDGQKTKTINIDCASQLNKGLDLVGYYEAKVEKKTQFSLLSRALKSRSSSPHKDLSVITDRLTSQPAFYDAIHDEQDVPWITNSASIPAGKLQESWALIEVNRLKFAQEKLNCISVDTIENNHEKAELAFQKSKILELRSLFLEAMNSAEEAFELSKKDRYKKHLYQLKISCLSDNLSEIDAAFFDGLNEEDYFECVTKSKILVLRKKPEDALALIKEKHPEKILGRFLIAAAAGDQQEIEEILNNHEIAELDNERDQLLWLVLASRAYYFKAIGREEGKHSDSIIPLWGREGFDTELLKASYSAAENAWILCERLGYPNSLILLLDVSASLYTLFNATEDLIVRLENIHDERPQNRELSRTLAKLYFNEERFEDCISLVRSFSDQKNEEDLPLEILAYYHLPDYEEVVKLARENIDLLSIEGLYQGDVALCVAIQAASETVDNKSYRLFRDSLEKLPNGPALLALIQFMLDGQNKPEDRERLANQLYDEYVRLDRPVVIATQLFRFFDGKTQDGSRKVIEMAEKILESSDLSPGDYLHLCQAYITNRQWQNVIEIADRIQGRNFESVEWTIVKSVALEQSGRVADALDVLEEYVVHRQYSGGYLEHFVGLSLRLGFLDKAEQNLRKLLGMNLKRQNKLSVFQALIYIYSADPDSKETLSDFVEKFGNLVDRESEEEEGQYLVFCLTLSPIFLARYEEKRAEVQRRLKDYTEKFPQSRLLKSTQFDQDASPEKQIAQIRQMLGFSEENRVRLQRNRNLIRRRALPIPFCELHNALENLPDIFASWVYAKNTVETQREYKVAHSASTSFKMNIDSLKSKKLLVDETAILLLHDIGALSVVLDFFDSVLVRKTFYSKLSEAAHPSMGSVVSRLPREILKILQSQMGKITLVGGPVENSMHDYKNIVRQFNPVVITDDQALCHILSYISTDFEAYNSISLLECMDSLKRISDEEFCRYVCRIGSSGIELPSMSVELLAKIYSAVRYEKEIFKEFKVLFRSVFPSFRSHKDSEDVFVRFFFQYFRLRNESDNASSINQLIRIYEISHPGMRPVILRANLFVYFCLHTKPVVDFELLGVSGAHKRYWDIFEYCVKENAQKDLSIKLLFSYVLEIAFTLDDEQRRTLFERIKHCFVEGADEQQKFSEMFTRMEVARAEKD